MHEHFWRNIKPDVAAKFNASIDVVALRASIVLNIRQLVRDPEYIKYRTAAYLELMTNNPPLTVPVEVHLADPLGGTNSKLEKLQNHRLKGLLVIGKESRAQKMSVEKEIIKGDATGLEVFSHLETPDLIFNFLEKMREFYLVDENHNEFTAANEKENMHNYFYEVQPYSKLRYRYVHKGQFPEHVASTMVLELRDFLKVPDLEFYLESFTDIMLQDKERMKLIVKPEFIIKPLHQRLNEIIPIDSLKIANYVTSQLFNPHLMRPQVTKDYVGYVEPYTPEVEMSEDLKRKEKKMRKSFA
jgi:hypothetical protein